MLRPVQRPVSAACTRKAAVGTRPMSAFSSRRRTEETRLLVPPGGGLGGLGACGSGPSSVRVVVSRRAMGACWGRRRKPAWPTVRMGLSRARDGDGGGGSGARWNAPAVATVAAATPATSSDHARRLQLQSAIIPVPADRLIRCRRRPLPARPLPPSITMARTGWRLCVCWCRVEKRAACHGRMRCSQSQTATRDTCAAAARSPRPPRAEMRRNKGVDIASTRSQASIVSAAAPRAHGHARPMSQGATANVRLLGCRRGLQSRSEATAPGPIPSTTSRHARCRCSCCPPPAVAAPPPPPGEAAVAACSRQPV